MTDSYFTFGKYLLFKQLSSDSLGTLWRAGEMERTGFKRIVWMRRFDNISLDRSVIAADAAAVNQLAGTLKATNIVRNPAFGSERNVPYLVWDYIPAQPLDQMFLRVHEEQFPVAIDNALLIVEKIAAALSAALSQDGPGGPLVHGFLIPHLVMIGNDGEAMVAGFGITHGLMTNLKKDTVRATVTPYLAPEVLETGQATWNSDVFSLGAILYQLLSGTPVPVDANGRATALEAPQMAFEEGPIPQDILAILRKAMAYRSEDRHGSAADFKKDLERLLYGGAYSPTTFNLALFMDRMYRADIELEDRELQREKTLDVGLYFQTPKAAPAEAPPPPQRTPAGDSKTMLYLAAAGGAILLGVIGYLIFSRPPAMDEKRIKEMIGTELTQKDEQIDGLQQQIADLQKLLEKPSQPAAGGDAAKPVATPDPEAARKLRDAQASLAKLQQDRANLEEKLRKPIIQPLPTRSNTAPSPVAAILTPTPVAVVAPTSAPLVAPTNPPAIPTAATTTPIQVAGEVAAPTGQGGGSGVLGGTVKEGDMVDYTALDVTPELLVPFAPNFSRTPDTVRRRISGAVIISALINERGTVDQAKVLSKLPGSSSISIPNSIDEACIDAVKKYRFKPALKGGVKVKTWTNVKLVLK